MWFIFSISCSILVGLADSFAKEGMQQTSPKAMAGIRPAWSSLFLIPLLFFGKRPENPALFLGTIVAAMPFEIAACIAFNTGLSISLISESIPFLSFTPIFLMVWDWLFLKLTPSPYGVVGVLLIIVSTFFLPHGNLPNVKKEKRILFLAKGSWLVILASVLFSVTAILAKNAIMMSSPFFFTGIYYPIAALFMMIFIRTPEPWMKELTRNKSLYTKIGLFDGGGLITQFFAFALTQPAYVVSLKRLSLLVSVLYGWKFFKEPLNSRIVLGILGMLAGVMLLAFK